MGSMNINVRDELPLYGLNAGDGPHSYVQNSTYQGKLSEEKIDSFNFRSYFTTPLQLKAILEKSHSFSIERMEILNNTGKHNSLERSVTDQFRGEIIDELFNLFKKKLAALPPVFLNPDNDKSIVIVAMLKRKAD